MRAVDYPLGNVAGAALYADGCTGHTRLVVDQDCRVVIAATFVGPAAGELLHAATIAVVGEVPLDRLWHAVPSSRRYLTCMRPPRRGFTGAMHPQHAGMS